MKQYCFECEKETEFVRFQGVETWEINGESFEVYVDSLRCSECGDDYQYFNAPDKDLTRQYRDKHGFLSGTEIKNIRESLNMSMDEFADMVNARGGNITYAELYGWHTNFLESIESDDASQYAKDDKIIREIAESIKK